MSISQTKDAEDNTMTKLDIIQPIPPEQAQKEGQEHDTTEHLENQPVSNANTSTESYTSDKIPPYYFVLVDPIVILLVTIGLYLITMGWLAPNYISSNLFGTLADIIGMISKGFPGFMKNLVLCVYPIHISQALFCLYICHQLNLNLPTSVAWFVQTLGLGMFALRFLIWPITDHTPSQEQKHQGQTTSQKKKDHSQKPVNVDKKPVNIDTKPANVHTKQQCKPNSEKRYHCYICGSKTHNLGHCTSYRWGGEMHMVLRHQGKCDQCLLIISEHTDKCRKLRGPCRVCGDETHFSITCDGTPHPGSWVVRMNKSVKRKHSTSPRAGTVFNQTSVENLSKYMDKHKRGITPTKFGGGTQY